MLSTAKSILLGGLLLLHFFEVPPEHEIVTIVPPDPQERMRRPNHV